MKRYVLWLCLVLLPATAVAQSTATVTADAPIYIRAEVSATPLRVAAAGTTLRVMGQQGDWLQVEFEDPQWGRRVGWVQRQFVNVMDERLRPMDLSVRETAQPSPYERAESPYPPARESLPRAFVGALGGVTFATETSMAVAGNLGGDVGGGAVLIGEFGYMFNVLPQHLQDQLDDLASVIEDLSGVSASIDAQLRAFYGMGGIRYLIPTGARVRPFAEAQVGFARLTFDVDAQVEDIDISDEVKDEAGLDSVNKFLLVVGGGIDIRVARSASVVAGYRYLRIFTDEEAISTNAVHGGVKFWF